MFLLNLQHQHEVQLTHSYYEEGKSLLLLMAAASVGAAHATPPASIGNEMSIVEVQEKVTPL